jgi:ABC-type branched-subunit amino acid transport system ATPase component/ABC-type branched-subunit amino acid transport system permease subunit
MRERSVEVRAVLAPVAFVVCLALLGRAFDTYIQYVFCLCLIAMMIGTALVPLVGYAKVVMLAGGAVAGIGAYVSSLLIINLHVPFLAAALVAALAGTLSGVVLGLPSVRFRGHHLAMVTLVFQALGIIVLREWKGMTGGAEGIRVPRASAFGYVFQDDASSLLLICGFLVVTLVIVGLLLRGSFGKVLRAITSSEVGAVAFGVRIGDYKVAAFALSCTFLSLAGAILAPQLKIIDPESFGLMQSINALAYPIVGGMTSVWGGVVGGGLLRALPEALRSFADFAELAFTVLALLVILLLPSGIVGGLAKVMQRVRGRLVTVVGRRSETSVRRRPEPAAMANEAPSRAPPWAPASPHEGLALEARRVSKSYGSLAAVSDVSLRVATGRIHGLIGPNGAGKTTLFNIISGLTALDTGELQLFGRDVRQAPAVARIGMGVTRTFQHVAVFDRLSCLDNVVIGLGENAIGKNLLGSFGDVLQGADARRRKAIAQEALEVVGLAGRSADLAGTLSLGDQRRLEVARAIASRPRLLLLDEPVSGVAREDEERLMMLLRELNEKWKLTMLLIEHNIRFVVGCCDRLSVMHQGTIVAEGLPQPVIASEQVQQIYFGKT